MTEIVAVADRIHALVAAPRATLRAVLAGLDPLRQTHGDEVAVTALATELLTASARLAARPAGADHGDE